MSTDAREFIAHSFGTMVYRDVEEIVKISGIWGVMSMNTRYLTAKGIGSEEMKVVDYGYQSIEWCFIIDTGECKNVVLECQRWEMRIENADAGTINLFLFVILTLSEKCWYLETGLRGYLLETWECDCKKYILWREVYMWSLELFLQLAAINHLYSALFVEKWNMKI